MEISINDWGADQVIEWLKGEDDCAGIAELSTDFRRFRAGIHHHILHKSIRQQSSRWCSVAGLSTLRAARAGNRLRRPPRNHLGSSRTAEELCEFCSIFIVGRK
jgi:hypothetical protein